MRYIRTATTPFTELNPLELDRVNYCAHIALDSDAQCNQIKLGAMLVCNKMYISSNSSRQQIGKKPVRSVHAEIGALIQHNRDNGIYYLNHVVYTYRSRKRRRKKLHNAVLYVVRFSTRPANDAIGHACGLAKPCADCERYLILHSVGTVKYSENVNGTNVLHTMKLVE
jgi:hypothetical protein